MIEPDEVRRIGQLARLDLEPEEVETLTHDLASILGYVAKLDELPTQDVEPTSHAVELPTVLRTDVNESGLDPELSLRGAPERLGDGFGVPKIIE